MGTEINNAIRRRTDRIIRQSFIELLQAKPFEQITVKDLCSAADINRATFYRYYPDLYALMDAISDDLLETMFTKVAEKGIAPAGTPRRTIQEYILEALTVIEENRTLCKILICNPGNSTFSYRLSDAFAQVFQRADGDQYQRRQEADLMVHYMANGFIGILRAWLNSDCAVARDEVAFMLDRSLMSTYSMLTKFK